MSHNIVECGSSPIIVNIADWLGEFIGRYSVGKRLSNSDAAIYAYSDDARDIPELGKYARKNGLLTLRSVSMKGVTTVERGQHCCV